MKNLITMGFLFIFCSLPSSPGDRVSVSLKHDPSKQTSCTMLDVNVYADGQIVDVLGRRAGAYVNTISVVEGAMLKSKTFNTCSGEWVTLKTTTVSKNMAVWDIFP